MNVKTGDIHWIQTDEQVGSGVAHPHVIVQVERHDDGTTTVLACALTTNLKRSSLPGNLLLDAGEANLPKASVVEVSKQRRIDAAQLGDSIGTLNERRLQQIADGIRFVQRFWLRD